VKASSSPFTSNVAHLEGAVVVCLYGELDLTNVEVFRATVSDLIGSDEVHLVLDLVKLEFVDVEGLRCLEQVAEMVLTAGGYIRVENASAFFCRLVDIADFEHLRQALAATRRIVDG
jgi:anti-anti-sigma factor